MPKKIIKKEEDVSKKNKVSKKTNDPVEKDEAGGGEKFFSEFSRSDFIGDGEVAEVDIVDAFDPAEELGFDVDTYKDDSY